MAVLCPYGQPGDRLWVRETLRLSPKGLWYYAADESYIMVNEQNKTAMVTWAHHKDGEVCASIHMPQWASRLTLEITGVRVERLQDISWIDAKAEGINPDSAAVSEYSMVGAFGILWDSINAKRGFGWNNNPWVWVIEFRRVTKS